MNTVTILTPTYNREKRLWKLFESLCSQTNFNFSWLIIDDGSTDHTEQAVSQMRLNAIFRIEYHKKENGGKHTALNYAYPFIQTPLTFIVDSDDFLTPDAVDIIERTYQSYETEEDLCGFSFLRKKPDGGYLSTSGVPSNGMKESFTECRINRGINGDMAEVWYTDCLREYMFPEFPGEKFLGEDTVWIRMAKKYKMRFFNDAIYVSDYLIDGLTSNRRKHNIASPNGCVARAETFLDADLCFKAKIKAMLQYQIYGSFAGTTVDESYRKSGSKKLFLLCWLPSRLLYYAWRRRANK